MAMACLQLVTFLPLLPDCSLPCLNSCISSSTFFWAAGPYLRCDFVEDFFAAVLRLRDYRCAVSCLRMRICVLLA